MLGPGWAADRWPVDISARGLAALDAEGRPLPGFSWWVPYGEGWEIPAGFEYSGRGPVDWRLWVQVINGTAQCVALTCVGPKSGPVAAGALRKLPLARLVHEAVLLASRPWDEIPKRHILWPSLDEAKRQREAVARQHDRVAGQRAPITDELLQDVANIYRNELAGGRPTAAVAEQLNYSRASAGRLVMKARDRGFLPTTEPRKARA